MRAPSYRLAKEAAQANANQTGKPYVVFIDTSGGINVERYNPTLACHNVLAEVFKPEEKK